MRCSFTGVYIIVSIALSSHLVHGNQDLQECQHGFVDELTLLQAAANSKSSKAEAEALAAKRRKPVCIEEPEALPETRHDFDAVDGSEPLDGPLAFTSVDLASAGSPKAAPAPALVAPAPALVFVLRAALWSVSLGVAISIAMRWLPCSSRGNVAVAPPAAKQIDSMVMASQRALHEAALSGDDLRCQSLLDMAVLTSGVRPPDVIAAADVWGNTALHAAAMSGARAVVDLFLEHGTCMDPRDAWDETPLHLASRGGHLEVCELLVARGASLRVINAEDMTPLVVAAHAGQEAVCSRLLEMGAGVEGLPEEELPTMLQELMVADLMARAVRGAPSSAAR